MRSWTNDAESAFLMGELSGFQAVRENPKRYGKVQKFINGLYSRFVTAFPLKTDETPDSKQKVIVLFSISGNADF